jgi:hypothetical protein
VDRTTGATAQAPPAPAPVSTAPAPAAAAGGSAQSFPLSDPKPGQEPQSH